MRNSFYLFGAIGVRKFSPFDPQGVGAMRGVLNSLLIFLLIQAGSAVAQAPEGADTEAVKSVLGSYKTALERLDLSGVEQLFAAESQVIENGKVEGRYADYRDHHIGPELAHIASFKFSDYAVTVRFEESIALATETYRYRIVLKDKPEPIERQGVATSVLKKVGGQWQMLSMHSSARAPKLPTMK